MSDVFVSYKKDDRAVAERLVAALRAAGKEVWWDDALTPHEAWDSMIERQIAAARVVIVLWSPRSVHSDWVRSEAHYAQDHHKMVPVMVEHCSIPLAFMLRQAVDLSDGRFDAGNPNWAKLLAWIDAVQQGDTDAIPETVPPAAAAAAAVPVKASSGDRWLGPASRPKMLAIALGVVALAALAFFALRGSMGFGQSNRPDVYVDPIEVAKGPGLSDDFAHAVGDELTAQLNAASRITPLEGDGKRHSSAYQMSGNVRSDNGRMVLYAKVFAPGINAPVLSPKIEIPEGGDAAAAKYLGTRAANLLRCIATASDSNGSDIFVLPEAAIRPWAQTCQYGILGGGDPSTVAALLEQVVKVAPDFANGWASLAEYRSIDVTGPKNAGPMREAIAKALAADPENPKATMLKALDTVGFVTVEPMRNLDEFEKLATKANKARPSDCGCEAKLYRDVLFATGRYSESLTFINRIIANDPASIWSSAMKAFALDTLGRTSEAKPIIDSLTRTWPGAQQTHFAAFDYAMKTGDWDSARAIAPKLQAFPGQSQAQGLIDALKRGDRAGMEKAVAPMIAGLGQVDSVSPAMLTLIAATGHDQDIANGFAKSTDKYGVFGFYLAWASDLKAARSTPQFVALVKKYNLPAYWRQPNHRPDACQGGADEPVCKLI